MTEYITEINQICLSLTNRPEIIKFSASYDELNECFHGRLWLQNVLDMQQPEKVETYNVTTN